MRKQIKLNWLHYLIAAVWIINGLVCKVLNLVPRHQEIVSRILGNEHSPILTILIGIAELGMAAWILSGIRKRHNTITQISVIAIMNVIEFFLVPDLLLWGKMNAIFAFMLIALIYYNEFYIFKKLSTQETCFHT